MRHVIQQTSSCRVALQRLRTSTSYLYSIQKTGTTSEVLLATIILQYTKHSSLEPVRNLLLDEYADSLESSPTGVAVQSCLILNAYPNISIARRIAQDLQSSFWINPCLPLLVHFALEDSEIWTVIIRESVRFPNTNDIQKLLARKGSVYSLPLFTQLRMATSPAEVELLSTVIWGLLPPVISNDLKVSLSKAEQQGPIRVSGIDQQRALLASFHGAIARLRKRFMVSAEARIHTEPHQYPLGEALMQSLCR